jgi:GNAT superfamily N-acetyltransferase
MESTLRYAELEDLVHLIGLCADHAAYEQSPYDSSGKAERLGRFLFSDAPELFCLVVECEGAIVGYATFMKEFSTWDADYYVHMDCLFLREPYRHQGIGKRLIQRIVQFARHKGISRIQWQTPASNGAAIRFYDSLGATSLAKQRFFMDATQNQLT